MYVTLSTYSGFSDIFNTISNATNVALQVRRVLENPRPFLDITKDLRDYIVKKFNEISLIRLLYKDLNAKEGIPLANKLIEECDSKLQKGERFDWNTSSDLYFCLRYLFSMVRPNPFAYNKYKKQMIEILGSESEFKIFDLYA